MAHIFQVENFKASPITGVRSQDNCTPPPPPRPFFFPVGVSQSAHQSPTKKRFSVSSAVSLYNACKISSST